MSRAKYPPTLKDARLDGIIDIGAYAQILALLNEFIPGTNPEAGGSKMSKPRPATVGDRLIIIGAGTGGPQALMEILPRFDSVFTGTIVVVQHMRPGFTRILAQNLSHACCLPVYEPKDGQALNCSEILIVPGGTSFSLSRIEGLDRLMVGLEDVSDSQERINKRIDEAMAAAADIYARNCTGVLLSGMGDDGREGMRAIAEAGGATLAQDEESSVVFDMPSAAIDAGVVHKALPLWNITDYILKGEGANANAA